MIRVLIGDDHPVVREGLKRILSGAPDMTVVADVATSEEVLSRSARGDVDVVLLDIGMPGPGFLETLRRLAAGRPRVLVLSVHPEDQYAVRAFQAGAAGYLTIDHAPADLLTAVRRVAGGGT
jgi:DNA-binding NarL/FixJ family response regulator